MTLEKESPGTSTLCVLVEGPRWGDAGFYGNWLLSAARVNKLLREAKAQDPVFREKIDGLESAQELDYEIVATIFVSQFAGQKFDTFVLDTDSEQHLLDFALMAEMGFFILTGDRYQMVVPYPDMHSVKQAHLKVASTEDEEGCIYPQRSVRSIPYSQAIKYQDGNRKEGHRIADRRLKSAIVLPTGGRSSSSI